MNFASTKFQIMARLNPSESENLFFNPALATFSFISESDLETLLRENYIHQIPVPKYTNKMDIWITSYATAIKYNEDGKLNMRTPTDDVVEYFWGKVKLPAVVVAGRLLGKWKTLYVLDGGGA
jgi:hypothetical protein